MFHLDLAHTHFLVINNPFLVIFLFMQNKSQHNQCHKKIIFDILSHISRISPISRIFHIMFYIKFNKIYDNSLICFFCVFFFTGCPYCKKTNIQERLFQYKEVQTGRNIYRKSKNTSQYCRIRL